MLPLPAPRNTDSKVVQVLRAHRANLDGMEAALMDDMGRRWLQIERGLDADISALAFEMARRRDAGEVITQQMVWRAERYKIIKAQLQAEVKKYNSEYAVGVVEAAQRQYAGAGIQAAQDAIVASYPSPLSASFNKVNVGAVESMIGFAGDGSPLYSLLREDYPDAVDGLVNALVNGLARGLGPGQIGRDMADGMGMGLDRALLIARTEAARSYRTASTEQYRQSGVVGSFMRLVKKQTACAGCLMLDGELFNTADELDDHPRGKAELPDNLILSSSPEALITYRYDGDVIVIRAASGKLLTVTPKHPVLTRRGWVQAAFVNESDDIISHVGSERGASLVSPNVNNVPTFAKDLARSFDMLRLGRVPRSAKHLYSDGESGDVDVVYIDRLLWDGLDATRKKKVKQYFFGRGNIGLRALDTLGALYKKVSAFLFSALRINSVFNGRLLFGFAHSAKPIYGSRTTPTNSNAVFFKNSADNWARHSELFCDCFFRYAPIISSAYSAFIENGKPDFVSTVSGQLSGLNRRSFGFTPDKPLSLESVREGLIRSTPLSGSSLDAIPSEIVFDSVAQVTRRNFTGHVYSFQTKEKWYVSNDIISHNCMVIPVVEGTQPPQWQKGQDWFLEQSEAEQKRILGPAKWQAWKDSGLPVSALAKHNHSSVWGSSPRPATIAELLGADGVTSSIVQTPKKLEIPLFNTAKDGEDWIKENLGITAELEGIDTRVLKPVVEELEELYRLSGGFSVPVVGEQQNIINKIVYNQSPSRSPANYSFGKRQLNLTGKLWGDAEAFTEYMKDAGSVVSMHPKSIISHELAHGFQWMDKELYDVSNRLYNAATNSELISISDYASTNAQEMVSEAFVQYRNYGDGINSSSGNIAKELTPIFDRIMSGGISG